MNIQTNYMLDDNDGIRCLNCRKPLTIQPKQHVDGEYLKRTVKCFHCLCLMTYGKDGLVIKRQMTDDLRKAGIVPEYYQPATVNRIMQSIDIKRDVVKYWRTK